MHGDHLGYGPEQGENDEMAHRQSIRDRSEIGYRNDSSFPSFGFRRLDVCAAAINRFEELVRKIACRLWIGASLSPEARPDG